MECTLTFAAVPNKEILDYYWPICAPRLAKALEIAHGFFEVEDLYSLILEKKILLVLAFNKEDQLVGEAVLEKKVYPRKRSLLIWLASAKSFSSFWWPLHEFCQQLAADEGIEILECLCRPAVARILKNRFAYKTQYWMVSHGRRQ